MKTTLITGTSKGIGYQLCKYFINKDHYVISISRNDIGFSHKNLIHLQQDVTHSMCSTIISNIIKNRKIDNCIINAGVNNNAMFHKMTYEDWFNTINTNLLSIHHILHPVLNNMRTHNNGNIVFMSSVLGKIGSVGASNYVCSKSAIYGLTRSLALENANKNIFINSISPGYINEGMGKIFDDQYKKNIIDKIPLKKFGEVEDIISIVEYLTENNKYITGSNINVNGGII